MTLQTFKNTDVLRLEVEDTPAKVNFIANQNGELGGWGWLTPVANTVTRSTVMSGLSWLYYNATTSAPNYFTSEPFPVSPGQGVLYHYRFARVAGAAAAFVRSRTEWLDANGALISSSVQSGYNAWASTDVGGADLNAGDLSAPAGTAYARIRFDLYSTNTGVTTGVSGTYYFRELTAVIGVTGDPSPGYLTPTYTNILGPTHSINITRRALDVGTLTAEILDASYDPALSTLIRAGKRCRVLALDASTSTWQPLFTGKILRGETSYDPTRTDAKRARITLTAVDAAAALAQFTRPNGVADSTKVPGILEGCGVPWTIDGDTGTAPSPSYVATSEDATALDQIAMTRDTTRAAAWVDPRGVLNFWTPAWIATTPVATLDESTYSDLALDYDTDRCINQVTVKNRRRVPLTGETVEDTYGPYIDGASVAQWGPHAATFTVMLATATEAAAASYAAAILTANATPAVRINQITVPIRAAADIAPGKALLDLYTPVTVANTNAGISQPMRPTGLEHQIEDGNWLLNLDFTVAGSVAAPQRVPALAAATPAVVVDEWVTPALSSPFTAVSGFAPRYLRDRAGNIHLQGRANVNGAASGSTLFTIPAGYRPSRDVRFVTDAEPFATATGRVVIEAGGAVRLYPKAGTPTLYYLDGIVSSL